MVFLVIYGTQRWQRVPAGEIEVAAAAVGARRVIIDQERSVVCALQERSIENPRTATADLGRQPQQQARRRQAPAFSSFPILTRR